MKVGTKSVLFGAHCFFIHPIFVFMAWWKLYGFPFDPRLWIAFFVHDLGYWGKPNMDGPEGETHVFWGARFMSGLFDSYEGGKWHQFCLYHSRYFAKAAGKQPSKLCYADKLSICLEPSWLYLPRVRMSGEVNEYMAMAMKRADAGEPYHQGKYVSMKLSTKNQKAWFSDVQTYLRKWVAEHKDGKEDTWTPNMKKAMNENGVW